MSRSRSNTPIVGMTTADSDNAFKQAEYRRERRVVKVRLELDEEALPIKESVGQ
ncbi:hypothetical protein LB553_11175 [Mesorhizobium sp. CA8]|uniref:hypothetical protein n=1 Tax=unclassified Mesorhizobium TaxID=325217 RepID=UPI001CCB7BFF|nr:MULTISPECIES: hypothetical protein [unclassified Mesorhizobium]MBZ9761434.1 hypothetical protein [Mesorhizobium sp. CA8]MBZ9821557.1 hypothetical protein [Mesorhizobium sp. CA4]